MSDTQNSSESNQAEESPVTANPIYTPYQKPEISSKDKVDASVDSFAAVMLATFGFIISLFLSIAVPFGFVSMVLVIWGVAHYSSKAGKKGGSSSAGVGTLVVTVVAIAAFVALIISRLG